jgi:hypothetical protein
MKIKEVIKRKKDEIENHPAIPYVAGAVVGLGLVVIAYAASYKGARDGLKDLTFEFNFYTEKGKSTLPGKLGPIEER